MKREISYGSGTRGPKIVARDDSSDNQFEAASSINRSSILDEKVYVNNFFNPDDKNAVDFYQTSPEKSSIK